MYKTIARKMRCSAAKVKKKYTRDRIFGIEYETKHGIKRAEFYHNGFRKSAPSKLDMDTTPDYRYSIRPKEVIARFMTGYCELCCKNELPVMIYQVKNLKSLSGNEPWEQFMLKKAPQDADCVRGLLQNNHKFVGWINREPYTSRDVRTVWGRGIWEPVFVRRKGTEFLSLLCFGKSWKGNHR